MEREGCEENTKILVPAEMRGVGEGRNVAGRERRPGAGRRGQVAEKINGDWHEGRDRRIPQWADAGNGEGSRGEVGVTESMWNLHGA